MPSSHLRSLIINLHVLPPQRCISKYALNCLCPASLFVFGTFQPYCQKQTPLQMQVSPDPAHQQTTPACSPRPGLRPAPCAVCAPRQQAGGHPPPIESLPDLCPPWLSERQLNDMQSGGWRRSSSTCASGNLPPGGSLSRCLFYLRAWEGLGGRSRAACSSKICTITGPLGGTPRDSSESALTRCFKREPTEQEMGDSGGEMKLHGDEGRAGPGGPEMGAHRATGRNPEPGTGTSPLQGLCLEDPLGGLSLRSLSPQGARRELTHVPEPPSQCPCGPAGQQVSCPLPLCSCRPGASTVPTCWNLAQPLGPAPQGDDAELGAQCVGGASLARASAGGAAACSGGGDTHLPGLPGHRSARTPAAVPPKVPARRPPSLSQPSLLGDTATLGL